MKADVVFKRKAMELANKLQGRFPSQLLFVVPALSAMDESELLETYRSSVHEVYGQRIRDRDESFFMTTDDLEDPMQLVGILRGLWKQMSDDERDAVWAYMDMFERLASV